MIAHRHMRLGADRFAQRRHDARLADARLTREQNDLALALAQEIFDRLENNTSMQGLMLDAIRKGEF